MAIGNKGFIGVKKEVTWGSREIGNNDFYLPFVSETLTANIEEVLSAMQRGVVDEPKSYQGERAFAGDIILEVHPASLGTILRSAFDEPDTDPAGTTETLLEDCEDAWDGNSGIISGIDLSDYKKGIASIKLQVPSGIGADTLLATEARASINLTTATYIKFWIKSSVNCAAGDLVFQISEVATCGGEEGVTMKSVNVPILVAGIWTECTIAITNDYLNAVISLGIKMHTNFAECIINIDDVRAVMVGEAATAKQHIFIPRQDDFHADCPLNPYTLEVYRDQGDSFQFLGGIVNTLKLDFSTTDKILKATCGIIAKNLGDVTKTSVALETTNPFVWSNAVISIGDSPVVNNDILSFGIDYNNACKARYTLNNTVIPRSIIRDGFRTTIVNFVIDFVNRTEYNKFLLGSEQAFQVKFEGAICDDPVKYTLQIDMPKVQYKAFPINIPGPGRLTCAVTAKANYDPTAEVLYAIKAKLINLTLTY